MSNIVITGSDLFKLIKKGDHNAFTSFYNHYFKKLIITGDKYLKDVAEAEEIVQNVFLKIWENPEKIKEVQNLKAYLFKAVINAAINFLNRKKNLERNQSNIIEFSDEYLNNLDEETDIIILVSQEIDKLPPQCKKVFKLSRYENLKHKEIALQLNISTKTVENHIAVALKVLRTRFLNDEFLKDKSKNYLSILNSYLF